MSHSTPFSSAEAAAEAELRAKEGKALEESEMPPPSDEAVPRIGNSVDLDNLFAFLADVSGKGTGQSSTHQTIQEIGDHMDQLVGDLDEEVS